MTMLTPLIKRIGLMISATSLLVSGVSFAATPDRYFDSASTPKQVSQSLIQLPTEAPTSSASFTADDPVAVPERLLAMLFEQHFTVAALTQTTHWPAYLIAQTHPRAYQVMVDQLAYTQRETTNRLLAMMIANQQLLLATQHHSAKGATS